MSSPPGTGLFAESWFSEGGTVSDSVPGEGGRGAQITLALCKHLHARCLNRRSPCWGPSHCVKDGESPRDVKLFGSRAVNGGPRLEPALSSFRFRSSGFSYHVVFCLVTESGREQGRLEGLVKGRTQALKTWQCGGVMGSIQPPTGMRRRCRDGHLGWGSNANAEQLLILVFFFF